MMVFNQSLTKSEDQKSVPGNVSVSMHVDSIFSYSYSLIPYLENAAISVTLGEVKVMSSVTSGGLCPLVPATTQDPRGGHSWEGGTKLPSLQGS